MAPAVTEGQLCHRSMHTFQVSPGLHALARVTAHCTIMIVAGCETPGDSTSQHCRCLRAAVQLAGSAAVMSPKPLYCCTGPAWRTAWSACSSAPSSTCRNRHSCCASHKQHAAHNSVHSSRPRRYGSRQDVMRRDMMLHTSARLLAARQHLQA